MDLELRSGLASRVGFTSAGPLHELLFVLRREGDALAGQVYTRHSPIEKYRWTGNSVRAERCRSDADAH